MFSINICHFILFLFIAHADCNLNISSSSLLFELDQFARQTLDPTFIVPGLFMVKENDLNTSAYEPIRTMDRLLGQIEDSTDIDLFPTSTGWRFIRSELSGHVDEFVIHSSALELVYIYTNSTGLMPGSVVLLRRGNKEIGQAAQAYTVTNHVREFPVRLIMHKSGNGTFDFPLPFQDISNSLTLGNDEFGRLTGDCSIGAPDQAVNIAGFTGAKREDCMGASGRLVDEYNCYKLNLPCPEDKICRHDRNASCTFLTATRPNTNRTQSFMGILKELGSWSLDPPLGSGLPWQKAFIRVTHNNDFDNVAVKREAQSQLDRDSNVIDLLLSRMVRSVESSLSPRPTSIDLTLVCVAVLSAFLAIDAIYIYQSLSKKIAQRRKNRTRSIWLERFMVLFVAVVASSPAFVTAAVIVYQETRRGMLNMICSGNGWHAELIWDNADMENVWLIRRVIADAKLSTTHGIRPLYIILPVILTILDFVLELRVLSKYYCEKGHGQERASKKDEDIFDERSQEMSDAT